MLKLGQRIMLLVLKPLLILYAFGFFLLWGKDKNCIKGKKLIGQKTNAISKPFDTTTMKAIGARYKGTINDVVLAMVSVALKKYLTSRGDKAESLNLLIPFSLRVLPQTVEEHKLNNDFSLLCFTLQLSENFGTAFKIVSRKMR